MKITTIKIQGDEKISKNLLFEILPPPWSQKMFKFHVYIVRKSNIKETNFPKFS